MVSSLGYTRRPPKPRQDGLTCVIDRGLALGAFTDIIRSHGAYIDFVKFGWGTAVVTDQIAAKVAVLANHGVGFWFGGTLFEIAYRQRRLLELNIWAQRLGAAILEISDGTFGLPASEKRQLITNMSEHFCVISEVGKKSADARSAAATWIEQIEGELAAGAKRVILEGREGGNAGIYRKDGAVDEGLIEAILAAGISPQLLLFEAPRQAQQAWFINRLGPDVNLANIAFDDVIALETLRRGLRADTAHLTALRARTQSKERVNS